MVIIIDCIHLFAFNSKTQFLISQLNPKLLIYLNCNVTLPLEDIGWVHKHIMGRIVSCWMQGNASEILLRIDRETICRWRDKFRCTGEVKDRAAIYFSQGLRASSQQFTSPLEFNAIFRDGFPLRLDLNGWSKIRDPVTAKFKHARLL